MLKSSSAALLLSCVLFAPVQAQHNDLLLGAGFSLGETGVFPSIYSFQPSDPFWSIELLHGFSVQPKVGFRYGFRFFQVKGAESSSDYVFVGDLRYENSARFRHSYLGIPLHIQFGEPKMTFFLGPEFNIRLSSHKSRDIPLGSSGTFPDLPSDQFSSINVMAAVGLRKSFDIGSRRYFAQLRYRKAVSIDGWVGEYESTFGLSVGTRFRL